ncbi:MAG: hypothetical protein J6R87_04460, partial [Rikenellaceae bacterium]|nr:hypothetical protein [Rikenellaceae bacterium]
MKKLFLFGVMALCALWASAQTPMDEDYADQNKVVNVRAQVRADFMQDYLAGDLNKSASGFKGRYL